MTIGDLGLAIGDWPRRVRVPPLAREVIPMVDMAARSKLRRAVDDYLADRIMAFEFDKRLQ